MDNVSAHELSQILRKASLLWAIPVSRGASLKPSRHDENKIKIKSVNMPMDVENPSPKQLSMKS